MPHPLLSHDPPLTTNRPLSDMADVHSKTCPAESRRPNGLAPAGYNSTSTVSNDPLSALFTIFGSNLYPLGKALAVGTPGGLFPLDFRGKPPAAPGLSAHMGSGVRVVNQDHRMKFTPRRRRLAPPCMAAGAIVGMDHTITLPCLAVDVWAAVSRGLDKDGIVRLCDQRPGNLKGRRFDPSP